MQLVSDNGSQFTSEEFAKSNGIKHIRCSPYQPASNGAVERLVQIFRKLQRNVARTYSKHSLTSSKLTVLLLIRTPAQLFLNHKFQTTLDLLLPDKVKTVLGAQAQQKQNHNHRKNVMCEFNVGEAVVARSNIVGTPDVKAVIKKRLGPLTYELETDTGLIWKRRVDYIKGLGTIEL